MNKLKVFTVMAAVLILGATLAACKKEVPQQTQPEESVVTEVMVPAATEKTTQPVETEIVETFPELNVPEPGTISYSEYLEMTVEEQQAYYEKFESPDAFFAWLDIAKAEYEAALDETSPDDEKSDEGNTEETQNEFFGEEGVEDLE